MSYENIRLIRHNSFIWLIITQTEITWSDYNKTTRIICNSLHPGQTQSIISCWALTLSNTNRGLNNVHNHFKFSNLFNLSHGIIFTYNTKNHQKFKNNFHFEFQPNPLNRPSRRKYQANQYSLVFISEIGRVFIIHVFYALFVWR